MSSIISSTNRRGISNTAEKPDVNSPPVVSPGFNADATDRSAAALAMMIERMLKIAIRSERAGKECVNVGVRNNAIDSRGCGMLSRRSTDCAGCLVVGGWRVRALN